MASLTFPQKPAEYIYDTSWFVGEGGNWVFGLPQDGQISSATCGAMPFRNGTGLCSSKCIRGEDWVFFDSWCRDREHWPSNLAWGHMIDLPYYNTVRKGPTREQLSSMYTMLSAYNEYYGPDFDVEDAVVDESDIYRDIIDGLSAGSHQLVSQPVPAAGNVPLEEQRIQNFFTDMAAMKCTIADVGWNTISGTNTLWDYIDDVNYQEPSIFQNYISSFQVLPIYTYYDENRPIQIQAQFIGIFRCHKLNATPDSEQTAYVMRKIGGVQTLNQSHDDPLHKFVFEATIGGFGMANHVLDLLNWESRPEPEPSDTGWARVTVSMYSVVAVVWPQYLQLP